MKQSTSSKTKKCRSERANITTALVFGTILFAALALALLEVQSCFISKERLESRSQSISLEESNALNFGNAIGQMNEAVVSSRECVFDDRRMLNEITNSGQNLQPLAEQLLAESRQGARQIENSRQTLLKQITIKSYNILNSELSSINKSGLSVPFFAYDAVPNASVKLGFLKNMDSNVKSRSNNVQLSTIDTKRGLVDTRTDYYKGNVNLNLPSPDDDLSFKIAALPSRVMNEAVKQSRLVDAQKFDSEVIDQLPSAVSVGLSFECRAQGILGIIGSPLKIRVQSVSSCSGDYDDFEAHEQVK